MTVVAGVTLKTVAQSTPPAGVTVPPSAPATLEQITPTPSESPPPLSPTPPPTSTPPPSLEIPANPPPPETLPPSQERFRVNKITVSGNTVLRQEIADLVKKTLAKQSEKKPPASRGLTLEELLELRSQITQLYLENGYVTSGAFLPNNQALDTGIVRIQVVEGELERIEISGLRHLKEGYVRRRLELATAPPLNRQRLESALQLLQIDPLIAQVNAQLTAGSAPGRNVLIVALQEAPAFHAGIAIDNSQSPSIGSIQGSVFAEHDNLLGFGDRLSASFGKTDGLDLYSVSYAIPLNPRNGTLTLRYSNDTSEIIESPFQDLGIRSESRTFSVGFRQPLVRSPQTEFALGLTLDLRRSQTYLLDDIPFSFSEGPEDGESKVTVLRFSQDWVQRGAKQVLAARSQFSFGIDAFGATINDTGTDGQFFAWLGQFQWVQQLSPSVLLVAQFAAQLTPDSLLSLERFSLGGINTVRGYRENQLVADNGVLGSLEFRIPLTYDPKILQIVPFFDLGSGWNSRGDDPDPKTIASLGLGVRWQIGTDLTLRLDYGIQLNPIDNSGDSLQDNGLYFSLRYQPF
ncbi:MAG: ShlB/FhaC/HecB family hemolysin secretion/activation protein [Kovacikia sp.]